MTVLRLQAALIVAFAVTGSWVAARAQDLPVATRGTVKVRSRVFNPFEVGQSRLTISPFGVFTVTEAPAPVPAPAPATGSETAPAPLAASSVIGPEDGFATSAVRPPFRPPTRSPWRPPPRPPFFPP